MGNPGNKGGSVQSVQYLSDWRLGTKNNKHKESIN